MVTIFTVVRPNKVNDTISLSFSKGNSYTLFSNRFKIGSVHFNLEMFPDDPLPISYSKTTVHVTVKFYLYTETCFGFKHNY